MFPIRNIGLAEGWQSPEMVSRYSEHLQIRSGAAAKLASKQNCPNLHFRKGEGFCGSQEFWEGLGGFCLYRRHIASYRRSARAGYGVNRKTLTNPHRVENKHFLICRFCENRGVAACFA